MKQRIQNAIDALLDESQFGVYDVTQPNVDTPNVYKVVIKHEWIDGTYGELIELKAGKVYFLGEEEFSLAGLMRRIAEQAMDSASTASEELKEIKEDVGKALETLGDIANY